MAAPSDLRAMAPAALGLAVVLVVVAVVQDRSIGRWTEVEDARLRTALVEGARELDAALTQQIAETAVPFVEIRTGGSVADSLADRLRLVGDGALPLRGVYWVVPGPSPTLSRLDHDARQLVTAGWWEVGDDWRRYFTRNAETLQPGQPLTVTNEGAPSSPPALALPALPSPDRPPPYVLLALDTTALAASTLPALVDEHLALGDAFDVMLGPKDEASLFASRADADPLTDPDLAWPVGSRLLTALTVTLVNDGERRVLDVNQGEISPGKALWEVRIQHRAGSIGAAVGRLRWQQRGLALAVLLVLGGAVALLVRSALAQRALARRQLAFVAGVSHELRTPLAVLGSAGENLADGVTTEPEAVREYGALVRDESRRLAETVESVLALGGVEAQTSRREAVLISEIVDEAIKSCRAVLAQTGTSLALDLSEHLPEIQGDRRALVAAVRNLVANAARHGGSTATLVASRGDGHVEIAVTDDGPGPPPGVHVFEPFVRGDASEKGSGLGLALVRRVAEHHGGTAALARTPDDRTRATITLPIAP